MTPSQPPKTGLFLKILQFPLVRIVLAFLLLGVITQMAQAVFYVLPGGDSPWMFILSAAVGALAGCGIYAAFVRLVERRPVTELALAGSLRELAAGVLAGAALFTLVIGVLWLMGIYTVSGTNPWTAMLAVIALSITSGMVEELLFRGILFRVMEESLGTWLSMGITALFFGLAHIANPNATLTAAIAIALEAGILLCAAYLLTRRLWLAIGIHFAWNFTQGGIFGVAGSGYSQLGLLQGALQGPQMLSGGVFGAEASIVAVVVCLCAGAWLIWQSLKKERFVKPFWARPKN